VALAFDGTRRSFSKDFLTRGFEPFQEFFSASGATTI
jgi:hypothetical protein